ncbi:hypothetical protein [Pseudomonas sp. S2_C03]
MSASSNNASIEQLHREVAALAEDMRNPAPNPLRAAMIPFALGAASALITFVAIWLLAKLI